MKTHAVLWGETEYRQTEEGMGLEGEEEHEVEEERGSCWALILPWNLTRLWLFHVIDGEKRN